MSFEEIIKKAGFELAEIKEAFIVEEITPYLYDNVLKQKLRLRLVELSDYKQRVKEAIKKSINKWDLSYSLTNAEIIEDLFKELGL